MAWPELRIYRDGERSRRLPLGLYPGLPGAPLILFSPGMGGASSDYRFLARAWQQAGYWVAVMEHPGSDRLQVLKLALTKVLRPRQQLRELAHGLQERRHRPLDARFLLDRLAVELKPPSVGMAGHSFGSFTALALGGIPVKLPEGLVSFGDERVKGVVAFSPHPPGWLFRPQDYARIQRPCLMLVGTRDHPLQGRLEATVAAGAEVEVIPGASHMTWAGWGLRSRACLEIAAARSLEFWSRTLKDQ